MPLDMMGFQLDAVGSLWIIIALASMLAVGGLFMFFYFSKIHPKRLFKIYSKTGLHTRNYRLYWGKVPTEYDIFTLLLGKKPVGFPIEWFKYDYFDGKKAHVGQFIEGRLFPLPLRDMLGTTTFLVKKCKKCGAMNKYIDDDITNCPECKSKLLHEPVVLDNLLLQQLKFNPEIEERAIFTNELTKDKLMPLAEYIAIYDVGAKIAEAMATSDDDTKKILDQSNPFITALIATLPLAILMIGFGLSAYVMWQGMGDNLTRGSSILSQAAANNKIATEYLYNMTITEGNNGGLPA